MFDSTSTTPTMQFTQAMGELDRALGVLSSIDVTEVDADVLGESVVTLLSVSRRVAGVQAAAADRFSTSGAWADSGARNARSWVGAQVNESATRIGAVITAGAQLRAHPVMAAAVARGDVSLGHLGVLAAAVKDYPGLRGALEGMAEQIVELARLVPPGRFAAELTAICHALDPAAVTRDERRRDSEAYVHLSPIGHGMWRLDGLLPAEAGTQLQALFDAAHRRLRAEARDASPDEADADAPADASDAADRRDSAKDKTEGVDVLGNPIPVNEGPVEVLDPRYTSRRNVDALRLMLNLIAPAKNSDGTIALPRVNGARPVIHAMIPADTLLDEGSGVVGWLERLGVPARVITAAKATLLACDATIEPLITRDGRLIATLPGLPTVPAHLRKAVTLRDQGCRIGPCLSAIDEIHHVKYLSQGGLTVMDNLVGLCWYHHHLIHHGNWTLTGDANTALTLTNTASGQHWTSRPPSAFIGR
jgi:hypothetical protein